MIMFKKIVFVIFLLAAVGNSWASTNLSASFGNSEGMTVVIILLLAPTHDGPTPAICDVVNFIPVIADTNGVTSSISTNDIRVEKFETKIQKLEPVTLYQNEGVKLYLHNPGPGTKNYAFEFELLPQEAAVCNIKVSAQTYLPDGTPVGAPFDLSESIKRTPINSGLMPR